MDYGLYKKSIPNIGELTITDSTAGLGGNTISFAKGI